MGIGSTIYEPGAPAGQESAVVGMNAFGNPTVTYTNPGGYDTQYTTALAGPADSITPGSVLFGGPVNQEVRTAGLPALIPVAATGIAALVKAFPALAGILGKAGTIAGIAGGAYGLLQGLGLGQGEGLFGLDPLGGDTQYQGNIPLGGPGLAEPPAQYVIKEWSRDTAAGRVQYYRVQMPNMKKPVTLGYYTKYRKWVRFKAPHLAVIGKGLPSHRQLTRLRRNLVRHSADARTILKITSPKSLRAPRRGRR